MALPSNPHDSRRVPRVDNVSDWRKIKNFYASPARVYVLPAHLEDDSVLRDEGLPQDLYEVHSELLWDKYSCDADSLRSDEPDDDSSTSDDDTDEQPPRTPSPKHFLSANAKPYIPTSGYKIPTFHTPARFVCSGPLYGQITLERFSQLRQLRTPSNAILSPVHSSMEYQTLVYSPELVRFLDDLLDDCKAPLIPSPLTPIILSAHVPLGTQQTMARQPPPPPSRQMKFQQPPPPPPRKATPGDLALNNPTHFPPLGPAAPPALGVKVSSVRTSPPPSTLVNLSTVQPSSLLQSSLGSVPVQSQVPAAVPLAAANMGLHTYRKLASASRADIHTFHGIPISMRNMIEKTFELNHLTKADFSSESCRSFMGLNQAAAIAVMEGVACKHEMVFPPINFMKNALEASLSRVIGNIAPL